MDDIRAGRALRLLRQRRGLTQAELAALTGVSQQLISLMERGHCDKVALETVRRVFRTLDARCELQIGWRGGALDRLLDEAHARLVLERAASLRRAGWEVALEVTYSIYGERGSIDVLAARPDLRAVSVEEIKSDLTSFEALGRKTDEKVRLVRRGICRERFGFDPASVARVLVLPDTPTARRQVARLEPGIDAMFPARTRELRAWHREPAGNIAGVVFISSTNRGGGRSDQRGVLRVRRPRTRSEAA